MLQFNGINWKIADLGSQALLLEPMVEDAHLDHIHTLFRLIESESDQFITDVVPAYTTIAIFYSGYKREIIEYLNRAQQSLEKKSPKIYEVEVDFNQGLDWDRVNESTGLAKSEIIARHSNTLYTVAMVGFIPGFIFLEGLDPGLSVPRLENPRTIIPAGSVGIGGNQTGIYSLESPGGWNIIGQSNHQFFDAENIPPITISPGDQLKFTPIV